MKRLDRSDSARTVARQNRELALCLLKNFILIIFCSLALSGGPVSWFTSTLQAAQARSRPTAPASRSAPATPLRGPLPSVMLGIDVLEASGFTAVRGKRIGLLTHAAGVNRRGTSTIEVLRRAPGVKLVALFAVEHGLYGDERAEVSVDDTVDRRSGLPVYSLYHHQRKKFRPTGDGECQP